MAATLKTLRWADLAVGITIFVLAALTGCANPHARTTQSSSSLATTSTPTLTNIPAPSFDGPNIVPSAPASPKAQASAAPLSGPAAWRPRVAPRDWQYIVIHHSATPTGSMAFFDKEHKAKGWDGVGYHFVIGNGTETGDGQVEVTQRWPLQKWGAHAKTMDNRFNEHGIGICLVGNFDVERPSPQQLRSLSRLVAHLAQTYRISPQNVVGHRDTKPTDCPGRFVNIAAVRSAASGATAEADVDPDGSGGIGATAESDMNLDPSIGIGAATKTDANADLSSGAEPNPAQTAASGELLSEFPQ
jgi:N-acetylmuramoyl-L-alanine amidase